MNTISFLLEHLLEIFPAWLVIVFLLLELVTIMMAHYWIHHKGGVTIMVNALIPIGASIFLFSLFYMIQYLNLQHNFSLQSLQGFSRATIVLNSVGMIYFLSPYWFLTYRKVTDRLL